MLLLEGTVFLQSFYAASNLRYKSNVTVLLSRAGLIGMKHKPIKRENQAG